MDPTPIDNLFAAVDVSGIASNQQTLLIAFIGLNLAFLAYAYVRKTMGAGKR